MQKRDGQGKAGAHTESGEEEAKGGEEMQKINREDAVQAALNVTRFCAEHYGDCETDCPFCWGKGGCVLDQTCSPCFWELDEFLRTRGLKHD